MEVQSRIVALALSAEVKMGDTDFCAQEIASIICDATKTKSFGIWL